MALKILRDVAAEIRNAEFYTIMVDEATDVSNVSQLVLCLRWVDSDLNPHEEFIGLHSLGVANADLIVHVIIKDILVRMNISLSKCRGQCYDGCSTMKGEKKGVAKQIKDIEKKALLTHCYTHSLNLAVGDTIKESKIMRDALETTHEITKLVKKSPKRDTKLGAIKKAFETEDDANGVMAETITLLCPTRWTVRAKSLGSIINNFEPLKELWDWSLKNCSDTDMKARIRGVDVYMKTFDYIYGAHLGELILSHSNNLSKTLQNPKLSAVQGQDCAHKTVITLERIRNEESWNLFWDAVVAKATKLGADDPKLPRRRNAPKTKMNDYFGYGEGEATHPETPQDMYRKPYYEALDLVITCIKDRFDQNDYKVYATLQDVLLKAAKKESFDAELDAGLSFYASDFDPSLLKTQLATFSADFPKITDLNFNDVHKYLQGLHSGMRTLLSQVFHLGKLILVCPATNATSERPFSALRRVKKLPPKYNGTSSNK